MSRVARLGKDFSTTLAGALDDVVVVGRALDDDEFSRLHRGQLRCATSGDATETNNNTP